MNGKLSFFNRTTYGPVAYWS